MYATRIKSLLAAVCLLLMTAPAGYSAVGRESAPPPPAAPSLSLPGEAPAHEPARPKPDDACRLRGVVACSSYGARQDEDLKLVLVDENGYRHEALIYKDDGTFYTRIPCSGTYKMSIELGGGAIELGDITLPPADTDSTYSLKIIHPGSMLELILEARDSSESDLTWRNPVVVPPGKY